MLSFKNFWRGIRLVPNSSDDTSEKGELQSLDSTGRLHYNDGSTSSALLTADSSDVLENKDLDDSSVNFVDNSDNTKKLAFQLSGITSGNTRTLTIPNASSTIVGTDIVQTLSNKTFSDELPIGGALEIPEISTPTTPSSGRQKLYAKTNGVLYHLNDLGLETTVGSSPFITASSDPATTGILRMSNNEGMYWRNFANSANVGLYLDTNDQFQMDRSLILNNSLGPGGGDLFMYGGIGESISPYRNPNYIFSQTGGFSRPFGLLGNQFVRAGGVGEVDITSHGNAAAAGDQDLKTFAVPVAGLLNNNDFIEFKFAGSYAANANTKQIKVKWAGSTVFDSGALAINNGTWEITGKVYRRLNTDTRIIVTMITSDPLLVATTTNAIVSSLDLDNTSYDLKTTGASGASAANDIISKFFDIKYYPAP